MVRVGTFNLNNLFSRFNFQGEIADAPATGSGGITLTFDRDGILARTFRGRLIKEKDLSETQLIADRIRDVMKADILAVQEVEHIKILKQFNCEFLNGMYEHVVLIEGNDTRFIDVGVLSKLPLGAIISHQTATHPDNPSKRVFSRDLLQVEVLDANGDKLFNLYNTHLKSHFVPFGQDPIEGARKANERRKQQAATINAILSRMERPNSRFVLVGDMNDPPNSEHIQPMLFSDGVPLVNALESASETREAKAESAGQGPGPSSVQWTHRFNPPGAEPPRYELLDHIWLSQSLSDKSSGAMIDRRTKHGGDGSDHDPAWVDLDI